MLVDPIFLASSDSPTFAVLEVISNGPPAASRVRKGVYLIGHFSFDHLLQGVAYFPNDKHIEGACWLQYPAIGESEKFLDTVIGQYPDYGVCDSIDQFFEHEIGKWLTRSERKFVVSFTKIEKNNAGGWRWHKWGEYIGNRNPRCEYLHDEDDSIQEVYCFHVYECLNEEAILKIPGLDDGCELMSVYEYSYLVRSGDLTHDDGYGYAVIDSAIQTEQIYPSMCPNTGIVPVPQGATHVVWYNI